MNLISLGVAFSLLASSVGALWPSATKVYPTSIPQTTQEVKWMTIEEAVAQSQKDGKKKKKIFIDVYTDWCGWCKVMDNKTFNHPEVAKILQEQFYPVKFNAEQRASVTLKGKTYNFVAQGRGYHELAAYMLQGKMSYPTVVFMDANFNVIQPIPGFQEAAEFKKIASYFGGDFYKNTPWEKYQMAK